MADKNTKESSQRGENSVLFSLSSLTAVGNNNQAQNPVNNQPANKNAHQPGVTSSDKSGLIDLKTLTALGAGSTAKPAGGGQAAPSAEPAVPAIFANTRRSSSKTGLIVAILLVLGLGGVAYYLYDKSVKDAAAAKAETDRLAAEAKAEQERRDIEAAQKEAEVKAEADRIAAEAKAEADRLKKEADEKQAQLQKEIDDLNKLIADREAAAAQGKSAAELAALDAQIKEAKDKSSGKKPKDGTAKDGGSTAKDSGGGTTATDNPPPVKKNDDLLDKYGGDGGATKEAGLADDQIKKVLSAYAGPMKGCRSGQDGDLKIKFTINADGSVSGVSASGSLAGSAVESCATGKVSKMRFPKSDGAKNTSYSLP